MEARKLSTWSQRPFQLSLRIRHPSLDPAEISRELRLEPEHSFRAGEPRHSRSGLGSTGVHAETYWLGTLDSSIWNPAAQVPEPARDEQGEPEGAVAHRGAVSTYMSAAVENVLDVALGTACAIFLRAHSAFFQKIRADGGQARILVSLSPKVVRGFTVTPAMGRILNELGVTIEVEFSRR
jgi:hypothetical protein